MKYEEFLDELQSDLATMSISTHVREYVLASCRQAYGMGSRDGYRECLRDSRARKRTDMQEIARSSLGIAPAIHTARVQLAEAGEDCL